MAYPLGHSEAEHERLIRQARWVAPYTDSFFRESPATASSTLVKRPIGSARAGKRIPFGRP
jgi:hypothetical protein